MPNAKEKLLADLNEHQKTVVKSDQRRLLVIAGAGSGKTEVMARRIAWWVSVTGVAKDTIVAFTFTERAAEEMKFRIRRHIQSVTPPTEDVTLGGMYVGTIHGYCLKLLRELRPDDYHNYDVIDEGSRLALVQRGYGFILGLPKLQKALSTADRNAGRFETIDYFLNAYDLLNEYAELRVQLASKTPPHELKQEQEWCKAGVLLTNVGSGPVAEAFALSAGRFYSYLRCRRFLDFSTSQSELVRLLQADKAALKCLRDKSTHLVVDEVQDINPVQDKLIRLIVGDRGHLTAVGDHRQAIYRFRGSRVELMADMAKDAASQPQSKVLDLTDNYRSTKRIIQVANAWARTITPLPGLPSPDMDHGRKTRKDLEPTHVAALAFADRDDEAEWIANSIQQLVKSSRAQGAFHDKQQGDRGISYGDIAILLRSSTDARLYMSAMRRAGIPAVVRVGPDLFSQPEVLLFLAALARLAGSDQFMGGALPNSLPSRIQRTLGCRPDTAEVIKAALRVLRADGIPLEPKVEERLLLATELIRSRMTGNTLNRADVSKLKTEPLRKWLLSSGKVRRVFPQALFHFVLAEAGVSAWDAVGTPAQTLMFHLGQFSALVKGIETPGWNDPSDFKYQVIALSMWGTSNARSAEAPLLVPPDAVTISTIHGVKGLEFAAVFLADVAARRFPSQRSTTAPRLPFEGQLARKINPTFLADNSHHDDERRLMYVALTRAERYLFVTHGSSQTSQFFTAVTRCIQAAGGTTGGTPTAVPGKLQHRKIEYSSDVRLVTSFSDLRYYIECPHDFYLRKVLGFAPTIDQAFGYGRGVHNIMRAVHSQPAKWAALAGNRAALEAEIKKLIEQGLLYLRYTTGEPADNMRRKATRIIADYVNRFSEELKTLTFEPEKEFETLIEQEQILVSGAIDVIRLDNPPRVTLIDFKSGHAESDVATKLDEDEMRLQVSIYGLAAKKELEYQPERGLVRYLDPQGGEKAELDIGLDKTSLDAALNIVVDTAKDIRDRKFDEGPKVKPRDPKIAVRCVQCDFLGICGRKEATSARKRAE